MIAQAAEKTWNSSGKIIGRYKNGNIITTILSDGTKIRVTNETEFTPNFAENIDIKITNHCDMSCPYCHEGSCKNGRHGDILNQKFIETLHPYQEVAIGGGDATSHPDLIPFLKKLKKLKVIANMTVNQKHFEEKQSLIKSLVDSRLIYGLGVSLTNPSEQFIDLVKQYPNAVIHTINGILSPKDIEALANNNLKLLILGYKKLRRGTSWFEEEKSAIIQRQNWLKEHLSGILGCFNVVSFDNLAIEQLDVRRLLSTKEWEEFYMGDDGKMTYYIDMVEQKFAKNSTAPQHERYDILNSSDEMFKFIREGKNVT